MTFCGKLSLRSFRQSQIDVVATEQNMIADGQALNQRIIALGAGLHRKQTKVSGAATDIADQPS